MRPLGLTFLFKVAATSLLMLAFASNPATASTIWKWNYSGSGITAGGSFTTVSTPNASGGYLITAITGTRNGQAITSLQAPGTSVPGNEPYTVDDLVFSGPGPQLTKDGFGFSLADGTFSNPFFADFLPTPAYLEFFSNPGIGHRELPVTFSAVITPEPATFTSVFGVLLSLSVLLSRKKHSRPLVYH